MQVCYVMQEVDLALLLRKGCGLGTLSHNFCSLLAVQARPLPASLWGTERIHSLVLRWVSGTGLFCIHPASCADVLICHAHANFMFGKGICISVTGRHVSL